MYRDHGKYQPSVLKEYPFWTLLLHERQRYLGRAVVWLARAGDMQRFSGLLPEELLKLRDITQEYEAVLDKLGFKPDHMGYSMLGNEMHLHKGHGHMHVVPRYKGPREFKGVTFVDDRWGSNHSPEMHFDLEPGIRVALIETLKAEITTG